MNDDIRILGCMDGIFFADSADPYFPSRYVLRCGHKDIPFEACTDLPEINLMANADFDAELIQWQTIPAAPGLKIGVNIRPEWRVQGGNTAYVAIPTNVSALTVRYVDPVHGRSIPVVVGQGYTAFGYFAAHRCTGKLRIVFFDADGTAVGNVSAEITRGHVGGVALSAYQPLAIHFRPPRNTTSIGLEIVLVEHFPDDGEDVHAFIFFTACGLVQTRQSGMPRCTLRLPSITPGSTSASQGGDRTIYRATVDVDAAASADSLDVWHLSGDPTKPVATFPVSTYQNVVAQIRPFEGNAVPVTVGGYDGTLLLYSDGDLAFTASPAATQGQDRSERFVVADKLCDGAVHVIELRDSLGIRVFARDVQIFPRQLTPWAALQAYCSAPYPYHLAPAAMFRYRALEAQLEKLQSAVALGNIDAQDLTRITQVPALHQVLVEGFEHLQTFFPLAFPTVDAPTVSVIIPVHNKFPVTYFCLCALLFAVNKASFEVIVVDDGSEDQTLDLLQIASNVTYCRNEVAQGFVRACNLGATYARGEYLVFLNNDTEPTVGWLDELLFAFENFDRVGMAGSKLLYPDGRLQEAGGIVWNTGNPWNYGRFANPWEPRFCYTRQADYLSGAAVMLPRVVWDRVGGFSDEFAPAYFEDTDLCFKVRDAGYKTYFVPGSIVYHFEGISNGTDVNTTSGLKRFQEVNRPKFKRKWANAVQNNGAEGDAPDLAKDRGILGRVLFIDYQTPKPDRDAGSYAAVQEMRLVQSLGYKVTFAATNMAYMGRYDEELQRLGIETVYAPFYLSLEELLGKRGAEFDAVYITRYYVAQTALALVRTYAPKAKVLFNNADLHFLRELRGALRTKSPEAMQRAVAVRDEELDVMTRVDVVLSYNEVEHAVIVSHNLENSRVVKCPWVVGSRPEKAVPGFGERRGIAFLGGYGHPPNSEAVEHFVRNIMPLLRSALPDVVFNVYGSGLPDTLKKLADQDVHMHGFVQTVDKVYDVNRVFVAPLLTGAGIKGKVLGALAHGIPCVLSPIAAESTGVRDGLECRIAETPEDWVKAITRLYSDPRAWQAMSTNAMAFTKEFYSFDIGRQLMKAAFEAAGIYRTL
jgi:GT2 family glycosyltransferase/glycosyltransferase involved in cell wall biosynthesis